MRWSSPCQPELCPLKAGLSAEDPLPRWWTHVAGELLPVPDRETPFVPHCGLSAGCLNIVITWQLSSPDQANRDRQTDKEAAMRSELAWEITHHQSQSILKKQGTD